MPLKLAIALRVWLPIGLIGAFFVLRLPTQADATPLEITAAMIVVPALTLLAAWSAAELMFRPAALKIDQVIAEIETQAEDPTTEPVLLTHEFHSAADDLLFDSYWDGDPATSNRVTFRAETRIVEGLQRTAHNYITQVQQMSERSVGWPVNEEYPYLGAQHRRSEP